MAENPGNNNAPQNNKRKAPGNNFFRMRYAMQRNRNTGPRERPVALLIPQSSTLQPNVASTNGPGVVSFPSNDLTTTDRRPQTSASFQINKKSGPYIGWQLYFPETGE